MIKKAKKTNSKKSQNHTGVLVLENKRVFKGIGIGYQGEATGEVCFNTSLTGYQEIISDPSYAGKWEAENPGVYFRNNVWHWRPLWDYVCLACGDTMTTSDLEAGHYNDGHEIDADQCAVIVERLEFLLKIGAVAKYEVERKTQDKESEDYPFDEENVIEFVNFVKHSGGFKIC